jgi:hypothetical protein
MGQYYNRAEQCGRWLLNLKGKDMILSIQGYIINNMSAKLYKNVNIIAPAT